MEIFYGAILGIVIYNLLGILIQVFMVRVCKTSYDATDTFDTLWGYGLLLPIMLVYFKVRDNIHRSKKHAK